MLLVFIIILVVFYLNRFEPENLILDEDSITISFVNKFFFKKKEEEVKINSLEIVFSDKVILLKKQGSKLA
jgi:hypothetical protein